MTFAYLLIGLCAAAIAAMVALTLVGRKVHRATMRAAREAGPVLHAHTSSIRTKVRQTEERARHLAVET